MVVVVHVPDAEGVSALGLAGVGAGVEDLAGQGLLVALDLAVVSGRVRLDPLVLDRKRLHPRAADVLACLDRPPHQQRTHRGDKRPPRTPTRLALGFRNLTNYIARALPATGGFRPQLQPQL